MDVRVGPVPADVHVVEVVRRQHPAPLLEEPRVTRGADEGAELLRRLERRPLEVVAEPGAEVPLGIGPRDRDRGGDGPDRLEPERVLDGRPLEPPVAGDLRGERREEVEDPGRRLVVLSERLEIEEETDEVARAVPEPPRVLLGQERILVPLLRREPEPDVVAQPGSSAGASGRSGRWRRSRGGWGIGPRASPPIPRRASQSTCRTRRTGRGRRRRRAPSSGGPSPGARTAARASSRDARPPRRARGAGPKMRANGSDVSPTSATCPDRTSRASRSRTSGAAAAACSTNEPVIERLNRNSGNRSVAAISRSSAGRYDRSAIPRKIARFRSRSIYGRPEPRSM